MKYSALVTARGRLDGWRSHARQCLAAGIEPDAVDWRERDASAPLLDFATPPVPVLADAESVRVPASFVELAETVICHSDSRRYALLYRLLWRIVKGEERQLLQIHSDADVAAARAMEKSVRRDSHKMKAFVRFREVPAEQGARRRFVAWFEPDHFIVARTAGFFMRRFNDMDWLIATPKGSSAWNGTRLELRDEAAIRPEADDETDELWRTYFANIFNPARLKVKAMQAEMPKKYWKNMPEAQLIPQLIAGAEARVAEMAARQASQPQTFHDRLQAAWQRPEPADEAGGLDSLERLRREAARCERCPLHCAATQTVFGEGPSDAGVMIVGEQPGDQEDLAGRPFVGPAGQLFDKAAQAAGLQRQRLYVTNAVKHFKYEPRGKRRIHQKPNVGEIEHCRWWLTQEIEALDPKLIVAMGASAYFALTGEKQPVTEMRGQTLEMAGGRVLFVTVHPSYLLRIPDEAQRQQEFMRFQDDLKTVRELMAAASA